MFDLSFGLQLMGAILLIKFVPKQLEKWGRLMPLITGNSLSYLSISLYSWTSMNTFQYFIGVVMALPFIGLCVVSQSAPKVIVILSICITVLMYGFNEGWGPVILGVVVCVVAKSNGQTNPIGLIISAGIISDFLSRKVIGMKTNKFKVVETWHGVKSIKGSLIDGIGAGLLIGWPTGIIKTAKKVSEGVEDLLVISNFYINSQSRGTISVMMIDSWKCGALWLSILLISLIIRMPTEGLMDELSMGETKEVSNKISYVDNLQLIVVVSSLIITGTLRPELGSLVSLVCVIGLSLFVKPKVSCSLFYSVALLG